METCKPEMVQKLPVFIENNTDCHDQSDALIPWLDV